MGVLTRLRNILSARVKLITYKSAMHTASADVLPYRLEFLSLFGQQETGANPRKSLESNL